MSQVFCLITCCLLIPPDYVRSLQDRYSVMITVGRGGRVEGKADLRFRIGSCLHEKMDLK